MPKGDGYTAFYAGLVCVICSLMLSVTASALRTKQDYNVELDRKLNVLKTFGVTTRHEDGSRLGGEEVERLFKEHIGELFIDAESGQLASDIPDAKAIAERRSLPLYTWSENGELQKYAFPVWGKGLWSTVYGYLALEKDLSTIAGVTFYKHGETPGLGAEVDKDWFQANFKGKTVFKDGKRVRFEVVKGSVADKYPGGNDHAVDGISGATITGNGVMRFINGDLDKYEKYFTLQRKG